MQQNQDIPKDSVFPQFIRCSGGSISTQICCSEHCKSGAFVCDNKQCQCRAYQHNQCKFIIMFEKFRSLVEQQKKQITPYFRDLFNQIIKNHDQIIEIISRQRVKMVQYMETFGIGEQAIKLVNLINEGTPQKITGSTGYEVWKQIQAESPKTYIPANINWSLQAKFYEKQINSLLNILAYDLTDLDIQIQKSIAKCRRDVTAQSLFIHYDQKWQFIYAQIRAFSNLSELKIANQNISRIKNLDNITSLKKLVLSIYLLHLCNNQIKEIENLDRLVQLRFLNLSHNQISKIKNLDNLSLLKQLILNDNQIEILENMAFLASLKIINLQNNKIRKMENLQNLHLLSSLHLNKNYIAKIQGISSLAYLQVLRLNNNHIEKLENVKQLTKLKRIQLFDNPLLLINLEMRKITFLRQEGVSVTTTGYM